MKKEKKKSNKFLKFVLFVVLVVLAFKAYPFFKEYNDSSKVTVLYEFEISEGQTVSDVAQLLEKDGVIKSKWTFILKQKFNSETYSAVYTGTKKIEPGDTLTDILNEVMTLPSGKVVTVTIPEGFSAEMMGLRFENNGLCTKEEFLNALSDEYDYEFIKHIPDGNYNYKLQGFLFPNTYEFREDASAHDIIDTMLAYFQNAYTENIGSFDKLFERVTIASLVEREAKLAQERPKISGVMYNRLEKGMKLQIDASAVYAKSNGMYDIENVNREVVAVDSVYNTYKVAGLPAGPICNPGLSSLMAAANPENHDFLYYHTDENKKDGSHIFTRTYDEHVATMK